MKFNPLDLVLIAITLGAVFIGIVKGFIKDIFSLLGIVVSIYSAKSSYVTLSEPFMKVIKTPLYAKATAFILVLIAVYIFFKILGLVCSNLFKRLSMGMVDRLCGALFGLLKGVLVCWLLIFILSFMRVQSVTESFLVPYFEKAFSIGASLVPPDFKDIIKKKDLKNDRA